MMPAIFAFCLLLTGTVSAVGQTSDLPSYDYDAARTHEIKPHRRTIPMNGVESGFNQLKLTLVISPSGDVVKADAGGRDTALKFWSELKPEVMDWKFTPFEENGKAVTAEIEEYIDLVPPERLPKKHIPPPALRPDSQVKITLLRTGCFGSCPSYTLTVSTKGISFEGHGYVVAAGKHIDKVKPSDVRKLARKFIAADFYSMNATYRAGVTDNPTYILSISIDGRERKIEDYVGSWVGMPHVISDLEDAVDEFAHTDRWIAGKDGLIAALQAEQFNFHTFDAQVMLKEAAERGQAQTVSEMLDAGVPLDPLPAPKPEEPFMGVPFEHVGWLTASSRHFDVLQVAIEAGMSKDDQVDKDLALVNAAKFGNLESIRALITYGANPNADLSKNIVTSSGGGMIIGETGAGSILIYAAESGNPGVVREILHYRPDLEKRDRQGKTAMFAAGTYRYKDKDGARVECVRLLAQAGADVNARDNDGNTPLHETFLTDVEEELLKLGADVNARNNDGETPIFTTLDDNAIPLFVKHGADLTIRNNSGQTVFEAAKKKNPAIEEALRKAIQEKSKN